MNPELCDRCRLKYSLLKCENCQETFCSECDSYIHSIISKKDHIRKMIYSKATHETISKLNLNFESNEPPISQNNNNNISQLSSNSNPYYDKSNNLTYDINNINNINLSVNEQENFLKNENNSQIIPDKLIFDSYRDRNKDIEEMRKINDIQELYENNKLNGGMSGFYINEIKNIYQCEKNELISKIKELSKELVDTKTNLGEHIDYLNNYIIQLENKHKEQISDLTIKNTNDLKLNSIKQDTRVLELESELNVEKEKNEKLQKKIEEYEQIIKNNKYNIEKLSDEKIYIDNAKKTSEDRLKQKIYNIEKSYSDEINKIKKNYETEINKIRNELDSNKMDYLKMTENSKENINKIKTEKNKEKTYYDNLINKLKEEIANKNIENEKLLNINRNLQQNNDELNGKLIEMNNEINNKDMEQKMMMKAMDKMKKEKNDFARTNSKYHSVIYGRFKKKEKSKEF